MQFVVLFLLGSASLGVFGKSAYEKGREARWFGRTYTETKIQREMVTSLLPSSCVHVEATLPPCRSVRNLQPFPEFVGITSYPQYMEGRQLIQPDNPSTSKKNQIILAPVNQSTSVGWAEYLGLVAPTVTVTAIDLQTTTVIDPRTVVTFSVKGCRPSRLPLDLHRCPTSQYGISIEEILPTSTQLPVPTATKTAQISEVRQNDLDTKKSKSFEIEPSSADLGEGFSSSFATEELSNVELLK